MNTIFYYHPVFLEHNTGSHPECSDRLDVILSGLKEAYGKNLSIHTPRTASSGDMETLHDKSYLAHVEALCKRGGGFLDGDTPVSARSFEAALAAAGALFDGADALVEERARSVFALVRPPGHHARPAAGMGFCLINNIAVAADYLKKHHGLERILIADFDVHHGNGTQEMFYRDESVYFLSIHRFPFYPGTGSAAERGDGPGEGTTLNIPVPYGTPPDEIVRSFQRALEQAAAAHSPQALLVSAGFDGFAEDPVGGLGLRPEHYTAIGRALADTSETCRSGKILSTLEGGYSLNGLAPCLSGYVDGLG